MSTIRSTLKIIFWIGLGAILFFLLRDKQVRGWIDNMPALFDLSTEIDQNCSVDSLPSSLDIGCLITLSPTVMWARESNNFTAISSGIPIQHNDEIRLVDVGHAKLEFPGGSWIKAFSHAEVQITYSEERIGFRLDKLNGTFSGDYAQNIPLTFKVVHDTNVTIHGTQFFIDFNPEENRTIAGNSNGRIEVNGTNIPEGHFVFADIDGNVSEPKPLAATIDEIEAIADGPFLIAVQDMNVRSNPDPSINTNIVDTLPVGQASAIKGSDPSTGWWQIACPSGGTDTECWISNGDVFTIAANTDSDPVEEQTPTPTDESNPPIIVPTTPPNPPQTQQPIPVQPSSPLQATTLNIQSGVQEFIVDITNTGQKVVDVPITTFSWSITDNLGNFYSLERSPIPEPNMFDTPLSMLIPPNGNVQIRVVLDKPINDNANTLTFVVTEIWQEEANGFRSKQDSLIWSQNLP